MSTAMRSAPRRFVRPTTLTFVASLAGCSVTGLGGSDQYGCKAPEGVRCESVSGTYANSVQNNLPVQRRSTSTRSASVESAVPASAQTRVGLAGGVDASKESHNAAEALQPLRSEPRILRLWFKAYLDSDQDLNDQGYVFVQVDNGRWLIERAQRWTREAFAPIRPPRVTSSAPPSKEARSTSTGAATTTSDPFRPATALPQTPGVVSRGKQEERP